jgi:hypothetical protein
LSSGLKHIKHQCRSCGGTPRGELSQAICTSKNTVGNEKAAHVTRQAELIQPAAVRANMRSILVAMMKSFSCNPLIFLVCSETVALPQPKPVRMMAFRFREFTNLLNECKRVPEIAEAEAPLDAVSFLQQLPVWCLCVKELSLLAREWRNRPATGSTGFASKSFGHVAQHHFRS